MVSLSSLCPSSFISSSILDSYDTISSSSDIICYDSDILIYYMLSTPFEHQIYLGFSSQDKLQEPSIENSFVGGQPLFLREPKTQQLSCGNCLNKTLTFMCQVFCPLEADHCYNRILYVFYCEQCRREFKCIKQQSSQKQELNCPKIEMKTVKEFSSEIDSQALEVKDLQKIRNKAKRQIQDEVIEEKQEEEFDSQGEEIQIREIQVNLEKLGIKKEAFQEEIGEQKVAGLKIMSQNMQETQKEEKDYMFEEYRKIMKEIEGPVILYSNIPISYNSQPINPRHTCRFCKAKLTPELQITQKMLLVSPKLIDHDWGSLFVFTCSKSCLQSSQQCLVVQFQTDAVKDSEISALKKRNKNKKRKAKSQQKKETSKQRQKEQQKKMEEKEEKQQEGDWD